MEPTSGPEAVLVIGHVERPQADEAGIKRRLASRVRRPKKHGSRTLSSGREPDARPRPDAKTGWVDFLAIDYTETSSEPWARTSEG